MQEMRKPILFVFLTSGFITRYRKNQFTLILLAIILVTVINTSPAQEAEWRFINGDPLPDAPELAVRGEFKVGVRTITLVNRDQIDILNAKGGNEPKYDRSLKLEIWYPAVKP